MIFQRHGSSGFLIQKLAVINAVVNATRQMLETGIGRTGIKGNTTLKDLERRMRRIYLSIKNISLFGTIPPASFNTCQQAGFCNGSNQKVEVK